jgi:hypothetical protein
MPNEIFKSPKDNEQPNFYNDSHIPQEPLTNPLCEICFSAGHKTSQHNNPNLIEKKDNTTPVIEKKYKPE